MTRYGMVIDLTKCQGCFNCQIACKDEHVGNDWPPYSVAQPNTGHFWMRVEEQERGTYPWVKLAHLPQPCMHCDDPPCLGTSTGGAGYKRPDGIVIFDPAKSAGRHDFQSDCPYGVVYWNETNGIPQKCSFCVHLLDSGWKEPRCVEVCPIGAISFGDLDDNSSTVAALIRSEDAKPFHPEYNTKPKVYYIGLPKKFLAGSVVSEKNECLEGADVTLVDVESGKVLETKTDNFGDFEFEDLNGRDYSIRVEAPGHTATEIKNIVLIKDTYLGELVQRNRRQDH